MRIGSFQQLVMVGLLCIPLHSSAQPTPTPSPSPDPSRLANISTRANVGVNDQVLIGVFIVQGSQPKRIILRAIGPSLASQGVIGAMADPTLELHDSTGATIATNDNWQTSPQASEISSSGLAPTNPLESAILATLQPGNYTAIVQGVNNSTGIALIEGYDLDSTTTTTRLVNISTRGQVGLNDQVLIGGFIISGTQPKNLVLRALGPSLSAAGVSGALANPMIELHNSSGAIIASNDNWQSGTQASAITATGLAPTNSLESAILTTLSPGNYTAIVSGINNTTGIGLVEVYDLDAPPPQTSSPIGIMYLTTSYQYGDSFPNAESFGGWTNSHVQGVAIRSTWEALQPSVAGPINWQFFDDAITAANAHNKKVAFLVTAGITIPYDLGGAVFGVTNNGTTITSGSNGKSLPQSVINVAHAGSPFTHGKTFSVCITTSHGVQLVTCTNTDTTSNTFTGCSGGTGTMSTGGAVNQRIGLPWDSEFQSKFGAFVAAFAARYDSDPHVVYIEMGGPGSREESYFVQNTTDEAALDALAASEGYGGTHPGLTAWAAGTEWVIDTYAAHFTHVPFILVIGSPYDPDPGGGVSGNTMQSVCDYGATTYSGKFAVQSDALNATSPPSNSLGMTEVAALSATSQVGYQFGDPVQGNTTKMWQALTRGIGQGAHHIEVYANDCDDPTQAANLTNAAAQMLAQ